MSGSIKKVQSLVAFPLSKASNQLTFNVGNENGQIDMKSSYLELEMTLDGLTTAADYRNVVLGHDGLYYNASALVRDAKLTESRSGKYISDLVYVNMLSNNLEYFSKGCNNVVSDALYDGKGHSSVDSQVVSVFNNQYSDQYPVIRCPLSLLYPGSIGDADLYPQQDDLTFRYLLEPQYDVFMKAVKKGAYTPSAKTTLGTYRAFNDLNGASITSVTATALGTIGNYTTGQKVIIRGIQNAVHVIFQRTVGTVTADAGSTPGNFTFTGAINATAAISEVQISVLTAGTAGTVVFNDLNATGAVLTSATPNQASLDIVAGTKVTATYTTIDQFGAASLVTAQNLLVASIAGNPSNSTVTLTTPLAIPTGGFITGLSLVPLYTNLSNQWSLKNAHLILYRRNVPLAAQQKMLVSNFESVNVSMVGGLNRFMYTAKAHNNAYNVYCLTPSQTNLFSTNEGLGEYQISVNNIPLTTIYIDSSGSAVHLDNMMRVLSNSPYYQPKNLSQSRDKEIVSDYKPTIFPGKIFHSLMKGEPHVLPFDEPDRDIKVELVAKTGETTPQKMVYIFFEKWAEV
jgi:hypothetical protein